MCVREIVTVQRERRGKFRGERAIERKRAFLRGKRRCWWWSIYIYISRRKLRCCVYGGMPGESSPGELSFRFVSPDSFLAIGDRFCSVELESCF